MVTRQNSSYSIYTYPVTVTVRYSYFNFITVTTRNSSFSIYSYPVTVRVRARYSYFNFITVTTHSAFSIYTDPAKVRVRARYSYFNFIRNFMIGIRLLLRHNILLFQITHIQWRLGSGQGTLIPTSFEILWSISAYSYDTKLFFFYLHISSEG